jgi:4-hydroxy-3-polyprenylbenzoate decarboxylase
MQLPNVAIPHCNYPMTQFPNAITQLPITQFLNVRGYDGWMEADAPRRLIVGITGASGTIYGIRLLELLKGSGIDTHLILSQWAARTLVHETAYTVQQVQELATERHPIGDVSAAIASGSFLTRGMVIAPCSMRTLGAIAHGVGDNLIHRAADVVLKERRRLVLAVREAPLSEIHLENMLKLARMGVSICPPTPAFYNHPGSLDDVVTYSVVRLLDQLGIHLPDHERWTNGQLRRERPTSPAPAGFGGGQGFADGDSGS